MKAHNVSVGIIEGDSGEIRIYCASFNLKGSLKRDKYGLIDEDARRQKQKDLQKILEGFEFPEETIEPQGESNG